MTNTYNLNDVQETHQLTYELYMFGVLFFKLTLKQVQ